VVLLQRGCEGRHEVYAGAGELSAGGGALLYHRSKGGGAGGFPQPGCPAVKETCQGLKGMHVACVAIDHVFRRDTEA